MGDDGRPSGEWWGGTSRRGFHFFGKTHSMDDWTPEEWAMVEQAARDKIARHFKPNKPQIILGPTEPFQGKKRFSVVYEGIPRKKCMHTASSRAAKMAFCDRVVTDSFLRQKECKTIMTAMDSAAQLLLSQGADLSLMPMDPSVEDIVGRFPYRIILSTIDRMRQEVLEDHRLPNIYIAGTLLSRLGPVRPEDMEHRPIANNVYWNPHIDTANKKEYDYSAVLYLNSVEQEFQGGQFIFLDGDADRVINPIAGRLITFTSSFENVHQVKPVTQGHRYALSVWLTSNPKYAYSLS